MVQTSVSASVTERKEKAQTIPPSSQRRAENKIYELTLLNLNITHKEARASFRPSKNIHKNNEAQTI